MFESGSNEQELKSSLQKSLTIIREYDWLINSYVLDFFVDDHWNRLPKCWKLHFESINPAILGELLCDRKDSIVWPLSLLSLRQLLKSLCIPRKRRNVQSFHQNLHLNPCLTHPKLKNMFTKCVKPKKRHEVEQMGRICSENAQKFNVKYIVDFGAGLGHLARVLGYGYGLKVCCLEMQTTLNEQARVIDHQFEVIASKQLDKEIVQKFHRPIHVTLKLTKDMSSEQFLDIIKTTFNINKNDNDFSFGIIGLHPCGDLAAILINLYLKCKQAKYLNIIGCCYMKLSTKLHLKFIGFPLSKFLIDLNEFSYLSYESREIACHAIEMYEVRLRTEQYESLKVHSYRAALEKILIKYWPHLKHSGLKSIKHSNSLTFDDYCQRAVKHLNIKIPEEDIKSDEIGIYLKQWKLIVIFYTLRLMFAPLIESILLNDRLLYLIESGCDAAIHAIFDPSLSPRNHITTAIKR